MIAGLSNRLKQLRKSRDLTQKQVHELVGIHPSVIVDYENDGKDPSAENLIKLSRLYSVSIDYLLLGTDKSDVVDLEGIHPVAKEAIRSAVHKLSEIPSDI